MSEFINVSVVKKANVYFGGKVNSRTLHFSDGSVKTLGFMLPGEYTFNTADKELMEILDGDLAMAVRHRGVINGHIVRWVASNGIAPWL